VIPSSVFFLFMEEPLMNNNVEDIPLADEGVLAALESSNSDDLPMLPPPSGLSALCSCLWRHEENRDLIFQEARLHGSQIFFRHLRIRSDGGLSLDGSRLFSKVRIFNVVVMLIFVFFNYYTVFANLVDLITKRETVSPFVVVVNPQNAETSKLFEMAQLVFAAYECCVMVGMGAFALFVVAQYNFFSSEEAQNRYHIWHFLHVVCHWLIPTMTNFSAMKTVQSLNPQVLGSELALALTEVEEGRSYAYVFSVFLFERLVLGLLGFAAFVLKFSALVGSLRDTNEKTKYEDHDMFVELALLVGFINQTFGITQIWQVETKRIFLFIFGGENSNIEAGELDRQEVYLACMTRHICRDLFVANPPALRTFKRAVALVSFDHYDVQSMILNEDETLEVDARTIRTHTPSSLS